MTLTDYEYKKTKRTRDIEAKKYHCQNCNLSFRDSTRLNRHFSSYRHNPNRYVKYDCDICDYHTTKKNEYSRHLQTKKHKLYQETYDYIYS